MKLLTGRKHLHPHAALAPLLRQVEALAQLLRSQTEAAKEESRFWAAEMENRPYFAPLGSDRFRNVFFALPPDFGTLLVMMSEQGLQQMTEIAGNSGHTALVSGSHDGILEEFRRGSMDVSSLFGRRMKLPPIQP